MKNLFLIAAGMLIFAFGGCAPSGEKADRTTGKRAGETYDPNRGLGKFTAENINLGETLDAEMAAMGEKIQSIKCAACHKMTEERLVGPGMKGVTIRRQPEWLMNFITDPDPMIDVDPELQAQLEICLVRMPNQNLSDEDARHILEYLRKNDGVK